ncbi:MAG: sulfur carrier protein ThiS [Planctomycetes bacterium]|nr:sulfur carrier protein ThiS [Planctomycetota bacterium]
MVVVVNGQEHGIEEGSTVARLLNELRLDAQPVAVELNGGLVRKMDYANTPLSDGDRLEIVTFVGGG